MRTFILIALFVFSSSAKAWDQSCIDDCLYNKYESPQACNAQCGVPQQPRYQIQQNYEGQGIQAGSQSPMCINQCIRGGGNLNRCIDKCQ